jgi:hypothetical protein
MPRYLEAMKVVVGCVKRRIGANNLSPGDYRMGKPIPKKFGISFVSTEEANQGK